MVLTLLDTCHPHLVGVLLPDFDGGEAARSGVRQLVLRGVHLGDQHRVRVLVLLSQLQARDERSNGEMR